MEVPINREPPNGWFTMGNSIKVDDLVIPLFQETPMCYHITIMTSHHMTEQLDDGCGVPGGSADDDLMRRLEWQTETC